MDLQILWYLIAAILVLVGLAGTVLPALPGLPLLLAGMVLAAWAEGFARVGITVLVILAVMTTLAMVADVWAGAAGAKRVGASGKALAGAVIGTFAGMFFGLPGILLGPFVGAMTGELMHRRAFAASDLGHAARVGAGAWIGTALAAALKITVAFSMLGLFVLAWLF